MTTTEVSSPRPLRILAIHRYFWPDTPPYASMLRAITARWVRDGHRVEILSTQPSYKRGVEIRRQPEDEEIDGVRVRRLDLPPEHGRPLTRVANIIRFCSAIVRHAISRGPYDVIMASTAPPVFVGAAARMAADLVGARLVYHCMDIHPEIGRISGEFRNPFVYGILRAIDGVTCRAAARVVVLSDDMKKAVRDRTPAARVAVINNFNLPVFDAEERALPEGLAKRAGILRLLFAGNVGRFQGLEDLVDSMKELSDETDAELVLMGDGKLICELKDRAGALLGDRIRFFPHQPASVARLAIRDADLGVVTLRPGVSSFAFPSKTMTYLAEGRPLLVIAEQQSDLARLVTRTGAGISLPPGAPKTIAEAIEDLARYPGALSEMSRVAAAVGVREFGQERVLDRWTRLMSELSAELVSSVSPLRAEPEA